MRPPMKLGPEFPDVALIATDDSRVIADDVAVKAS